MELIQVLQITKGNNKWDQISLVECFHSRTSDKFWETFSALPCFLLWDMYLSRNKMILQGMQLNQHQVDQKIRSVCDGIGTSSKEKYVEHLSELDIDNE